MKCGSSFIYILLCHVEKQLDTKVDPISRHTSVCPVAPSDVLVSRAGELAVAMAALLWSLLPAVTSMSPLELSHFDSL